MNKRVIGMMSGTSLDGIDVVLTDVDLTVVDTPITFLYGQTYPYSESLVQKIRNIMDETMCTAGLVSSVHFELAIEYSKAIKMFLDEFDINKNEIFCIACHGQTVYHINEEEGFHLLVAN